MHLHFLGICGTFMGSLALLARELGHRVTGSDQNVYPPMSTQLQQSGIELIEGYDPQQLEPAPDLVVIGNAMSRGNPCVEAVLERGLHYTSGPQWLHDHLLQERWVLAVSGTHGKTTTASMLAWILEYAGMQPGYLIGGVPGNFQRSARLGETDFFVIEADEYDTAFFDKRSKFVHYSPRTLIINNIEYDHADIFPDIDAIERQFHHLMRLLPQSGQVIAPSEDLSVQRVLQQGCWSGIKRTGGQSDSGTDAWIEPLTADGAQFALCLQVGERAVVDWALSGEHNQRNALHAALAARHVGVPLSVSAAALGEFRAPKRRMELLAEVAGFAVYDDFAHHPTAIRTTLAGVRAKIGARPLVAVIEPRSNTMKRGVFKDQLNSSVADADQVYWYQPADQHWSLADRVLESDGQRLFDNTDALIEALVLNAPEESSIVIMSNGGFEGIHDRLIEQLRQRSI